MIIYIHGFASSGLGDKPKIFKEYFKNEIITPSLSTIPFLAIHTLEDIIKVFLAKMRHRNYNNPLIILTTFLLFDLIEGLLHS